VLVPKHEKRILGKGKRVLGFMAAYAKIREEGTTPAE